jgi:replicative DNA helicase
VAYLASLTEGLPRRPVIEEYIRIVKDKSLLRKLMGICSAWPSPAPPTRASPLSRPRRAESQLLEVSEKASPRACSRSTRSSALLRLHRQPLQAEPRSHRPGHRFHDFDRMTSGLQKGELIIIAARPSMGKTALAINIAQNAAVNHNAIVAVFSLEMSKESLLRRMLASQAWVDQRKLQTGFLGREDQASCSRAGPAGRVAHLHRRLGRHLAGRDARQGPPPQAERRRPRPDRGRLPATDVGHVPSSGKRKRLREPHPGGLGHLARPQGLAKELHVPVVALSQLSRASERRGDDKRPMLSDLRESGSIEQDADVVAFIHREAYYNRDEEMSADADKAKSEIIIAKQRNGPTPAKAFAVCAKNSTSATGRNRSASPANSR